MDIEQSVDKVIEAYNDFAINMGDVSATLNESEATALVAIIENYCSRALEHADPTLRVKARKMAAQFGAVGEDDDE